jgi:tripartite-type tricarboxylate transporter receptor subunit TctC
LLRSLAGIQFTQVSYKGSPQALTALMSGEIEFYLMGSAGSVGPQVKAGRIRALGVGAKQRISILPDVPAIGETIPGYEARGWNGILAPARTPKPIVDRLHREVVQVVRSKEFAQAVTAEGATAVGNTPAEFDAIIRADLAKWAKIIRENGIRAQ